MEKTCGTCGKCRNTHDGPYCYKGSSPRPVSTLRVMDCWVDPSEVEQAPVMTKVCSVCGRELPVSEFGRHSRTKDGYQPFCRQCHSEMNKGHKKRQPFQHNEAPKKAPELTPEQMGIGKGRRADHPTYVDKDTGVTMKWCRACKQYKPIDEFHRNKANKDGHEFDCKVCHNARVTAQHARKRAEKKAQKEAEIQIPATQGGLLEQAVDAQKEKKNEVMTLQIDPSKIRCIDPRDLQHFDILQIVHELRRRGFHGSITIDI